MDISSYSEPSIQTRFFEKKRASTHAGQLHATIQNTSRVGCNHFAVRYRCKTTTTLVGANARHLQVINHNQIANVIPLWIP